MSLHPSAVQTERVYCPSCSEIVDRAELLEHELPGDLEELEIPTPASSLEKYRGGDHIRVYARIVHITRECARCHEKHVN